MKTVRFWANSGGFFFFLVILCLCGANTFAQSTVPVVTVQATLPVATATNPGVFTVFRAGDTNAALNVWYDLGGTASNGVDYAMIPPHIVQIAAGAISNIILIAPLTDNPPSSIAKTVVLTLTNSPLMTPVNYQIGSPSRAVVYLRGNSNIPPVVAIVSPQNGAQYYTPTNIQMLAKASDPDGTLTNVEFFAGTNDLGRGSALVLDPPGVNGVTGLVYYFNWLNPPPGKYPITAVATDNTGASTVSAPVKIAVLPGPPTNQPPVVRIIGPPNGSTFFAPVNIPIYTYANDPDGSVASVEFFDGANSLGFGHPVNVVPPPLPPGPIQPPILIVVPTNYWLLTWSNAPVGSHALTAKATDNKGAFTISDPVKIVILPSPPPPTNRPAIVNIVATDPIAIEGTNCWVWPGETNATPSWSNWNSATIHFFTNCGPKTATFTVHRFGNTNSDLAVTYAISGTASNGVDYVALPGSVTIPASARRALISVVPIDDGPPDVDKTVILALTPSTNTPPEYLLGFPRRAGAMILDSDGIRPLTAMLSGGTFHLATPGPNAAWFAIDYSTDMIQWTPVCTNQVVNGSIDFVDPDAQSDSARFYRARSLTAPPGD